MRGLGSLIARDTKLFFKDKGTFLVSLITPLILLLLFVTFLGNVYRESFHASIPAGLEVPESLIEGFVGGWLFSSLLATSCVTVAFCSNMLVVQDKMSGARHDLTMTPVKGHTLALGYAVSTALSTLLICAVALGACMLYLSQIGWYLTGQDIALLVLDVLLLVLFGTLLSSCLFHFCSTQGQITAVGTIISSCYGFVCGAYMPISQFSPAIRKFIGCLPGTYGTALLRTHLMHGVLDELSANYFPKQVTDQIAASFDISLHFFDHDFTIPEMYLILGGTVALLLLGYVVLTACTEKKN